MGGQLECAPKIEKLIEILLTEEMIRDHLKSAYDISSSGRFSSIEDKFDKYMQKMFSHVSRIERTNGKEAVQQLLESWFGYLRSKTSLVEIKNEFGSSFSDHHLEMYFRYLNTSFIKPLSDKIGEYIVMFDIGKEIKSPITLYPTPGFQNVWKYLNDMLNNNEYMTGRLFEDGSKNVTWLHRDGVNSAYKLLHDLTKFNPTLIEPIKKNKPIYAFVKSHFKFKSIEQPYDSRLTYAATKKKWDKNDPFVKFLKMLFKNIESLVKDKKHP